MQVITGLPQQDFACSRTVEPTEVTMEGELWSLAMPKMPSNPCQTQSYVARDQDMSKRSPDCGTDTRMRNADIRKRLYSALRVCTLGLFIVSVCLFQITGGSSKAKDGLPQTCKHACSYAISLLDEVSRQIRQGDITFRELKKIHSNLQQITRLYRSVLKDTEPSPESGSINSFVKMRLEEFQVFQEELGHLQHLCHVIPHAVIGKIMFPFVCA